MYTPLRWQMAIQFEDREGNVSPLTLTFPSFWREEQHEAANNYIVPRLAAVSDATIRRIIWKQYLVNDAFTLPPVGSNVRNFVGLFYSNSGEYACEALWIPSPRNEIFETDGLYAGIRVEALNPQVQNFLAPFLSLPIVTPEGEPFSVDYIVGGKRI